MVYTPRKDFTPEQRIAANTKLRDKYNQRKAAEVDELRQQLDLKNKENAALRSAIRESNPGAGSRKTAEGGIKKTGQQASRHRRGGDERQDNENEG